VQRYSTEPRGHADNILPMVQEVLLEATISLSDLQAIAFTRGPGAFTGVRIGTSVAQGLALGANLPLIAVSSLAVLAQGSYRDTGAKSCLAALDARMSEVYFGVYQVNENGLMVAIQDDQVAEPLKLSCNSEQQQIADKIDWQARGPGWTNYSDDMLERFKLWQLQSAKGLDYPQAVDLLTLANCCFDSGELLDPAEALPIYVRDQVVRQ